jgi:hypothetical protein
MRLQFRRAAIAAFAAASWVVCLAPSGRAADAAASQDRTAATGAIDPWLDEPEFALRWPDDVAAAAAFGGPAGDASPMFSDPQLDLTQAAAPLARTAPAAGTPTPSRVSTVLRRPGLRGAALGTLASIPYMIGDTGSGTCIGFSGLVDAELHHPSLACSRLNISEANSPLPMDRLYYSYRHYHNANEVSAYSISEVLDFDQHVVGWENTFWDRTGSLELRVPIENRLRSDIFSIVAPNFGVVDALVAPGDGRCVCLGNISLVLKMLLWERPNFAMSGGLGLTLPTAKDVNYQLAVDGEIEFPDFPGLTADEAAAFQAVFATETVYLAPFLAWIVAPSSRWFHQGFLQFETAANPSRVTIDGDGATLFLQNGVPIGFYDYFTPVPVRAELFAQPIMRLNLGWGYILAEQQRRSGVSQLAGLFELHYSTTLADANLTDVPLTTQSSVGTVPLQTIELGNMDNRVDILNAAAGVQARWGSWVVSNGIIAPLRRAPDRGFDCEYNVQVQRLF